MLSGYSQRVDSASGHTNEDDLYSVRVERNQWSALNFDTLEQISPVEALAGFDLRRNMTMTGIFEPVAPLQL